MLVAHTSHLAALPLPDLFPNATCRAPCSRRSALSISSIPMPGSGHGTTSGSARRLFAPGLAGAGPNLGTRAVLGLRGLYFGPGLSLDTIPRMSRGAVVLKAACRAGGPDDPAAVLALASAAWRDAPHVVSARLVPLLGGTGDLVPTPADDGDVPSEATRDSECVVARPLRCETPLTHDVRVSSGPDGTTSSM